MDQRTTLRMPIVGGNWKMNTDLASAVELAEDVAAGCSPPIMERCDVVVYPPFPYLQAVGKALGHHSLVLGAQDVYPERNGAYTGEVSTEMLLDLNATMVLAGHSERRHVIGETDDQVSAKTLAALAAGLHVTLCVGETMEQREGDQTEAVCLQQLTAGLREVPEAKMRDIVIAYEPVWAIGTGRTATPEDAQAVHEFLRGTIGDLYGKDVAIETRIQYGGSVKPENAADLITRPDIDGFLVGGASLNADQFISIIRSAVGTAGAGLQPEARNA